MKLYRYALAAASIVAIAGASDPARGSFIVTAVQTGGDVVLSGTGTLDLTSLGTAILTGAPASGAGVDPDSAFGLGPGGLVDWYDADVDPLFTGPASFGPGTAQFLTSGSGDNFGFDFATLGGIVIETGYVSGSALSGTAIFVGETFASLGMAPGDYTWSWASDSITLNIVPEPSTGLLLGGGLLGLGVRGRRKKA